ncbi:arabinose operon transcriptional regulator AraC [Consotaella salsifontis]|uniref:Transcriptional regulator, AraC family n=1 Tax=Consotaella salsifontis TaxID=1365950 RepID=A0A1T4SMM2_9HYPH|nr:arabinose operon transcriptional regulator AraC [Consotaella salsifontis]SKA29479.1 transcriptional regulator, AraC family [Consotaella salsifontis]
MSELSSSQAERIIQKLARVRRAPQPIDDPDLAPLMPGYGFATRLTAGITPIERGSPLDFVIERPKGMAGWIINLTVRGRGRIGREEGFDAEAGDLLLFSPGIVHHYGRHPDAENWWHRWVYFQPRAFWASWLAWKTRIDGVYVLRRQDDDLFREQDRLFAEIASWPSNTDPLSMELSMNLLERLILLCAKQNQTPGLTEHFDERLLAACRFMIDNLHRPMPVEVVARAVCLSPSRLAHLFSRKLGLSVMRWWEEQRIQKASQLLQITNMSVKQISAQVGYDDPLYFARVFRKHQRLSPKAFRERHGAL